MFRLWLEIGWFCKIDATRPPLKRRVFFLKLLYAIELVINVILHISKYNTILYLELGKTAYTHNQRQMYA